MIINTVKRQENENGELSGYILNGNLSVPLDEGNRHYLAILEWIELGGIPESADVIEPPNTTEKDAALVRLKEKAKTDESISDILILLNY